MSLSLSPDAPRASCASALLPGRVRESRSDRRRHGRCRRGHLRCERNRRGVHHRRHRPLSAFVPPDRSRRHVSPSVGDRSPGCDPAGADPGRTGRRVADRAQRGSLRRDRSNRRWTGGRPRVPRSCSCGDVGPSGRSRSSTTAHLGCRRECCCRCGPAGSDR